MANLNFKHLRYFWAVAREGGIVGASELLNVTPQTISGQLKLLESDLGVALLRKSGRNLVLTEAGQVALSYCEKMFQLEGELELSLLSPSNSKGTVFRVGVLDVLPKLMVYQMLEPVLENTSSMRLICHEGAMETLLADLAVHKLHMVLSDCPVPPSLKLNLFSHRLGECGTVFFGAKKYADKLRAGFPESLTGEPLLIQSKESSMHSDLRRWLQSHGIFPTIKAEIEDSALLKVFGEKGYGVFNAPAIIERSIIQQHNVEVIGYARDLRVNYYAISADREIEHPSVAAITDHFRALINE